MTLDTALLYLNLFSLVVSIIALPFAGYKAWLRLVVKMTDHGRRIGDVEQKDAKQDKAIETLERDVFVNKRDIVGLQASHDSINRKFDDVIEKLDDFKTEYTRNNLRQVKMLARIQERLRIESEREE